MKMFRTAVDALPAHLSAELPPVVYDAEAVSAAREIQRSALLGTPMPDARADDLIRSEVTLGATSDVVIAVSELEGRLFAQGGARRVVTLGHAVEPRPTPSPFDSRRDFLFVGSLEEISAPNIDGLRWFIDCVWPTIRGRAAQANARLLVAGSISDALRASIATDAIEVLGRVDDLAPLYGRARVFIAPTRYSAGIPLKVLEAAAHGIPIVAKPQAALQLGWTDGVELRVGEERDEFAARCLELYGDESVWNTTRAAALRAVETQASYAQFRQTVERIVQMAVSGRKANEAG